MKGSFDSADQRDTRGAIRRLARRAQDKSLSPIVRADAALEVARAHASLREFDPALRWTRYAGEGYASVDPPAHLNQAGDAYELGAEFARQARNDKAAVAFFELARDAFTSAGNESAAARTAAAAEELRARLPPPPAPGPGAGTGPGGPTGRAPTTAPAAPAPPALEAFLALAPDDPEFWEKVNQRLNVDELEEAAAHASPELLARTIAKTDEIATLWDRSLRPPGAERDLLRKLTQNWFARRRSPSGGAGAPTPGARRGPLQGLVEPGSADPTQLSLMERLGNLQSSCVRSGLRVITASLALLLGALLAGEVALFALVAYHSTGGLLASVPLLAVWPPTILLVSFLGGERIYSNYYQMYRRAKAVRLWDQPSIRLAAYLVVMMVVQLCWFASDVLLGFAFKVPGVVVSNGSIDLYGIVAFLLVLTALGALLAFMTMRQRVQSTRWTSVGGSLVYLGLTAGVTIFTIVGGIGSAVGGTAGSAGGLRSSIVQLPIWFLTGFAGLLLVVLLVPYLAHRWHRGRLEDRLRLGQAYLDDLDPLPAAEGARRMPRLSEIGARLGAHRTRTALDGAFRAAPTAGRWTSGELVDADGVAVARLELEWARGSQASQFFGHLLPTSAAPAPAAAPAAAARVPTPPAGRSCERCGEPMEADSVFCSACGWKAPG